MARYTGPRCRKCRALGISVCGSEKCALLKKEKPPGMHGPPRRASDYKRLLVEKQRLRHIYWLAEKQFAALATEAKRMPGVAGQNLLRLLEQRLDSLVYRAGWGKTMPAARQLVVHGHVEVDGALVDRPSYRVRPGQVIRVAEKSREVPMVKEGAENPPHVVPPYLARDGFEARLTSMPEAKDIPVEIQETLIIEYYAR